MRYHDKFALKRKYRGGVTHAPFNDRLAYDFVNIVSVCKAESSHAPVTVWTLSKPLALFLPRLFYKIHRCRNGFLQHYQTFHSIIT